MTLLIDLPPEMETQLREQASKEGIDAPQYVVIALKEHIRQFSSQHRSEDELLMRISQGLPEQVWEQYDTLIAKRRAEMLTPEEHNALIALSDRIEDANAERIGYVAELAELRHVPLNAMMRSLGIGPRPNA